MRTRDVDGVPTTAYFASDFTLAEIKTCAPCSRAGEPPQGYNGLYEIPTLDEVIALAKAEAPSAARVGIYPEIKHSTYHATTVGFGANCSEDQLSPLHAAYGNVASAPVFIQSFEVSNLQYSTRRPTSGWCS